MPSFTPSFYLALLMAVLDMRRNFAEAGSFLRAGQIQQADAEKILNAELGEGVSDARLILLEEALRSTFISLPKDAEGNLGHQAVRYVLHRFFVQRYGWYIKGLEPNSNTNSDEWVPSFLQSRLEKRLGDHGTKLHDLAALAAALEDIVREEVNGRMKMAYNIHELPLNEGIESDELVDVLGTFYINYLLSGNFSARSRFEAEQKKKAFALRYKGWTEAEDWFTENVIRSIDSNADNQDFATAIRLAEKIGEDFHRLNDVECRSLKITLKNLEGRKAGRVRLSVFYKTALYSHWHFNEKEAYLRALGALDESDANQPQVILPNYIMARTNCLEASNLYALCCRNECEDLMGNIEKSIKAPEADPDQIAALVATLPSDTVDAPRELPASLLGRLAQVAESNAGRVPLHGRLFAQWMHHAFPRECPYPHEAGKISVQTPDDWIKETGHDSTKATQEEMVKQVESDTCAFNGSAAGSGCGDDTVDLPWSEAEELLTIRKRSQVVEDQVEATNFMSTGILLAGFMAFVLALIYILDYFHVAHRYGLRKKDGILDGNGDAVATDEQRNWKAIFIFAVLLVVAHCFDLLDRVPFAFALFGGIGLFAARCAADRFYIRPRCGMGKCCI